MSVVGKTKIDTISDQFIEEVCSRLVENKPVRRVLPEEGMVHIDRQLPFLCIYRNRQQNGNPLSKGLITGAASYLIATANRRRQKNLSLLVKSIAGTLIEIFGSFLIVEVWISAMDEHDNILPTYNGEFKIISPKTTAIPSTIESFERFLRRIKIRTKAAEVDIVHTTKISPPGLPALVTPAEAKQLGVHIIGIEVSPIYLNAETGEVFPLIQRALKRGFARALNNGFFEFTHNQTSFHPAHFHSLGRRSMVKAVWDVDRQLAEICSKFDFLLQITPVNSQSSWFAFQRNGFEKTPQFVYRPIAVDPALAKRRLYQIPIERIEDPSLAQIFREQQLELGRKFTMLTDRGTRRFLYGSLQLYGPVEDDLMNLSVELLKKLPSHSRDEKASKSIDAKAFAELANKELAYFRQIIPACKSKVLLREDIAGLMVSNGNLLIGTKVKIPTSRVEALIAHEIATHVLTYINGKAQPFQQLYIGLSGYDELQEGLAVLSEYMVDGLTGTRMRLLAARVVAAHHLANGASFVEVFRDLNKVYGFARRTAYNITIRIFRGGGLTKDAIYLRGLIQLLEYLKKGGELEPLFVGKISAEHVAIIKELQLRKVLRSAPLRPTYLDDPKSISKLKDLRNGLVPINLIKPVH